MTYKDSKENLYKEGRIKKCPVDFKAITKLIERSYIDLKTAKRNLNSDEECAYNYAYNAIMRSTLALMFSEGFRPEIKDKHKTIVRFAGSILGDEFKRLINDYDFMRKKRNRLIYEPDIPCSIKEAKDAIKTAEQFVEKISKLIQEKNPQKELQS